MTAKDMTIWTFSQPYDILSMMSKHAGRWGMYLSVVGNKGFNTSFDEFDEFLVGITEAAPYLGAGHVLTLANKGYLYCFFESEADLRSCFEQTVGDEGATPTNPYYGDVKVYALTCNPQGEIMSENT